MAALVFRYLFALQNTPDSVPFTLTFSLLQANHVYFTSKTGQGLCVLACEPGGTQNATLFNEFIWTPCPVADDWLKFFYRLPWFNMVKVTDPS